MKVAVLTSGGVDSSVALMLLRQAGHDVTAFYLKIWLEDELAYLGECPWEEDLKYVQAICEREKIPLEIVPMQKEYWDKVVSYTVAECKVGRTPNPDVLCNEQIKFGLFYDKIDASFEKIATGHYAQVEEKEGMFYLKRAPDPVKDQTYFLARLSQKQLARALFPIGHLKKEEVRVLAQKFDLPNQARKDSQGICFLGKIPYREFIKHHLGEKEGDFVDQNAGKKVGTHKGYWFYTIGQRSGLGLSGGPWFVAKKDLEKNVIILAHGYAPEEVKSDHFKVGEIHFLSGERALPLDCQIKIRHSAELYEGTLGTEGQVSLKEPLHGVAPGQFAVFYDGDSCVASGVIA
jgi:tRNA-specific 2-thiouridylase